ncbi:MAG: hypothetical protein WC366_04630 [Bacilli bacterium]|jgi:hypothetical protein
MKKNLLIIPILCLVLCSCSNNSNAIPFGGDSTYDEDEIDPTDEEAMRSTLVSGVGFNELSMTIEAARDFDSKVMQVDDTYRQDVIHSTKVGDAVDKNEKRVVNVSQKRYINDVIYTEYSGNADYRDEMNLHSERGDLQITYLWSDLVDINLTSQYLRDAVNNIYFEKIADYNVSTYESFFYLGIAREVPALVSASDFSLAGKLDDGTIYARKQALTSKNFTYNGTIYAGSEINVTEYFYKDSFLKQVRISRKVVVDTNSDGIVDLTTEFLTQSSSYSTTSNGKYDKNIIPEATSE